MGGPASFVGRSLEPMPTDFANLLSLGRAIRPAWKPYDALTVNDRPLRIVRFEGHHSGFHAHDVDECYVVLEGEILVEFEVEAAKHLRRGDAYVVRAGTVHRPFAVPMAVVLLIT
jgi:mannose-6-phosphate isomerase-like protein (cupin superfamily)